MNSATRNVLTVYVKNTHESGIVAFSKPLTIPVPGKRRRQVRSLPG
jgi:hypothetical protein